VVGHVDEGDESTEHPSRRGIGRLRASFRTGVRTGVGVGVGIGVGIGGLLHIPTRRLRRWHAERPAGTHGNGPGALIVVGGGRCRQKLEEPLTLSPTRLRERAMLKLGEEWLGERHGLRTG
jgi:hypothetical protein